MDNADEMPPGLSNESLHNKTDESDNSHTVTESRHYILCVPSYRNVIMAKHFCELKCRRVTGLYRKALIISSDNDAFTKDFAKVMHKFTLQIDDPNQIQEVLTKFETIPQYACLVWLLPCAPPPKCINLVNDIVLMDPMSIDESKTKEYDWLTRVNGVVCYVASKDEEIKHWKKFTKAHAIPLDEKPFIFTTEEEFDEFYRKNDEADFDQAFFNSVLDRKHN